MSKTQLDQRLLASTSITIISLTLITAVWLLLVGSDPKDNVRNILVCLVFFAINALTAAASLSLILKSQYRILAVTSMAVSLASFLLITGIFLFKVDNGSIVKLAFTMFLLSIGMAHVCRLFRIRIINRYAAIARIIALVGIAACASTIIIYIFLHEGFDKFDFISPSEKDFFGSLFAEPFMSLALFAMFVINFGFSAATPILNKLEYGRHEELQIELDEDFLKDVEF